MCSSLILVFHDGGHPSREGGAASLLAGLGTARAAIRGGSEAFASVSSAVCWLLAAGGRAQADARCARRRHSSTTCVMCCCCCASLLRRRTARQAGTPAAAAAPPSSDSVGSI